MSVLYQFPIRPLRSANVRHKDETGLGGLRLDKEVKLFHPAGGWRPG